MAESSDNMGVYELAPDGLPDQILSGNEKETPLADIPPFPLGDLAGHLNVSGNVPGRGKTAVYELLFVLLPLFFMLPILFQGKNADGR